MCEPCQQKPGDTQGQGGRELARTTVSLGKGPHGFVYARSIEGHLVAHTSETLWMDES